MVGKHSASDMLSVEARTASFQTAVKLAPRQRKVRWPHDLPTAEALAFAGFFYAPYPGSLDNVCCYLCDKNMSGWEATDDPLREHLRGNHSCAWAVTRDILVRTKNGDELGDEDEPASERIVSLREATFGIWWPHDLKKGWNPKSKKMAKAGFFYTPSDKDDQVTCPYCLLGLDGWEPKDDPIMEHRNRMPTCPFFAGLHKSLPSSTTASPVKSVPSESPTTARSHRNTSATAVAEEASKNKNKRRLTRQADVDDDPEIFTTVESPPPTKRRKSARAPSQAAPKDEEETPAAEEPVQPAKKGRIASTQKGRAVSSRRKSTVEPPASPANRRLTRSGLILPPPDKDIEVESNEDEPPVEEEAPKKKTPAKPKGNHRKTKSRTIAAEPEDEPPAVEEPPKAITPAKPKTTRKGKGRAVAVPDDDSDDDVQIIEAPPKDKTPAKPKGRNRKTSALKTAADPDPEPAVSRRATRSGDQLSADLAASEEPVEEEQPAPAPTKAKRGRKTKTQEENEPAPQTGRRTRQSNVSQPPDEPEEEDEPEEIEPAAKPAIAIIVPKRTRASARTTRTVSSMVQELPEIEEDESEPPPRKNKRKSVPVIEIPDSTPPVEEPEEEEEEEEIVAPPRGKKAARGRARSTILRNSSITLSPVQETAKPRRARTSKRDISAVYDDIPEAPTPAPKRKASNTRSIQRIPTPSEEEVSSSDVFEDSKSTFSDLEEIRSRRKSAAARPPVRRVNRRSKAAVSEERETEDAPSTIYHSADDYQSSPRSPSQSSIMGRSKREMVDHARKELEEEIWQERVANGEVGLGGSSEDDEKENAAEEKGKKPTRTVRGKGGKGRSKVKRKGAQSKVGSNVVSAAEDDAESSAGESHALVVKAMASPMKVGPVVADQAGSDESSVEEAELVNGHVTPVQSPRRKMLSWSPAKIEAVPAAVVPNGVLSVEEEEMTVDAWMKWVINDEVRRLQEECEKLVKNLEREGERARRLLEHLI